MAANERQEAFRLLSTSFRAASREESGKAALQLAYGVVRHRERLDWIIEGVSDRKKANIESPVLQILRLGVYQVIFNPATPPYAIVSESVELAKKVAPRAGGFVNWVLRKAAPVAAELPRHGDIADRIRWLATFYSFPLWMAKRWHRRYGPVEAEALMASMNIFPPLHIRVNRLRTERRRLREELETAGGDVSEGAYCPAALHLSGIGRVTDLPAFGAGRFYIQDESSQLAALALAPEPGESLLDACSGVGGKATHLAEITGDGAAVSAVDTSRERLALLQKNTDRLGLRSVSSRRADILAGEAVPGAPFDRALLDAPCSGLGTIRRHPELKWTKRASDPKRLADVQLRLLTAVADMLRPGGVLAYSTCTIETEENEGVVRRFLRRRRDFTVETPSPGAIDRLEELVTDSGFIATLPHRHGMNGAFVALLRRSRG